MDNEQRNPMDDLLDRATDALRNSAAPDGPPDEVIARTLAALQAKSTNTKARRTIIMRALVKIAAVVVIVLCGAALLNMLPSHSTTALADVIQRVREVKAVRYKQTITLQPPDDAPKSVSVDVLVSGVSRMRTESGGDMVMIMDWKEGKYLMLRPQAKLAMIGEIKRMAGAAQINLLEHFQKMDATSGKPIGQRDVAGHKANGFQIEKDGQTVRVWADPESELPLLVEIDGKKGQSGVPAYRASMSEFVWDPPVDEAQVSLKAPEGYRVQEAPSLDISESKATDVTDGLHAIAELNGGVFPAGVDMSSLQQVMKDLDKRLHGDKAQQEKMREKMQAGGPAMVMTIGRMWMFMDDRKKGDDWHYAGEGVAMGQRERPVLWYRPAGSPKYRVINGDLSEHDVAAEDLPKVPSKLVTHPSKPAATQP